MSTLNDNLRDAAYIVIGMSVISAQRAQVRRAELRKQFEGQREMIEAAGTEAVKLASEVAKQAESFVKPVIETLRTRVGV
jgi:hypothetical protein